MGSAKSLVRRVREKTRTGTGLLTFGAKRNKPIRDQVARHIKANRK